MKALQLINVLRRDLNDNKDVDLLISMGRLFHGLGALMAKAR